MRRLLGRLLASLVLMALGGPPAGQAQPAGPPAVAGHVHAVIYVEVMPTSLADGLAVLKRYREATLGLDGSLRCEVLQRLGQPHQLVVLEVWRDQKAFEAHGADASARQLRERIAAIRAAPTDERVHGALSVGPLTATAPGAVHVVTHVDVIPPRKDDGVAALKRLGEVTRTAPGNLRFEVVQQANRPNHFTVVETWTDARAVEAHLMAAATREFRDALAAMTGALYDERTYKTID
jgi:quinol monooxygenase YgiN